MQINVTIFTKRSFIWTSDLKVWKYCYDFHCKENGICIKWIKRGIIGRCKSHSCMEKGYGHAIAYITNKTYETKSFYFLLFLFFFKPTQISLNVGVNFKHKVDLGRESLFLSLFFNHHDLFLNLCCIIMIQLSEQ